MRSQKNHKEVRRIRNKKYNSAILFAIRGDIEHKVAPVTEGERRVLAGWFVTEKSAYR